MEDESPPHPTFQNAPPPLFRAATAKTSVVRKMVFATHLSDFKDFIKSNNKIPPYARDFKKEYLFIRGINKEFKYFIENMDKISTYEFFHNTNVDRITKLIKIFLRGQEKGKIKDISGLYFREYDILNIIYFKNMATRYFTFKYKSNYNFGFHNLFFYIFSQIKYIH